MMRVSKGPLGWTWGPACPPTPPRSVLHSAPAHPFRHALCCIPHLHAEQRCCWPAGKRVAETLCMDYHREHNLEVRIIRIFNTYGPRMALDDGRVVSNFVAQALTGQPITVYGEGSQTRSFQYVTDLVKGMVTTMDGPEIGPFNIGNPGEFTMLELANLVKEVVNPNAEIVFRPNTADDPGRRK